MLINFLESLNVSGRVLFFPLFSLHLNSPVLYVQWKVHDFMCMVCYHEQVALFFFPGRRDKFQPVQNPYLNKHICCLFTTYYKSYILISPFTSCMIVCQYYRFKKCSEYHKLNESFFNL